VTIGGWTVHPRFTLDNTKLQAAVDITIPNNIGVVGISGEVNRDGQFSLSGNANLTVAGVPIRPSFTLTNSSLQVALTVSDLPLVGGQATIRGDVNRQGEFTVRGDITGINLPSTLSFVTLSAASATLTWTPTEKSLTVRATATGLPSWINSVQVSGTVSNRQLSLTVGPLDPIDIYGFTVRNLTATLTPTQINVSAEIPSASVFSDLHLSGQIGSGGFRLTARTSLAIVSWLSPVDVDLTLNNTNLSLSASATVPVIGQVLFRGAVSPGQFTISVTGPNFSMLGGPGQLHLSDNQPHLPEPDDRHQCDGQHYHRRGGSRRKV